jgi:hypothetical protein
MRVNFKSPTSAAKARLELHQAPIGSSIINCYFAQPVSPIDMEDQHLQPPALTKQFLISPPASPPFGWEQKGESDPLVNYDLLAAIANLTPGMFVLSNLSKNVRCNFLKQLFSGRVLRSF